MASKKRTPDRRRKLTPEAIRWLLNTFNDPDLRPSVAHLHVLYLRAVHSGRGWPEVTYQCVLKVITKARAKGL